MNNAKAIYLHIPFCNSICAYCDFPKLQYFSHLADLYIKSLKNEFDLYGIKPGSINTIYIGGGTPTALNDHQFEDVLKLLSVVGPVKEFTVEANPESLSLSKINLMKKYGVNRISIGVESTDDHIIKAINRVHSFNDVIKAVELCKKNGINNINLDLILGLPNSTSQLIQKDIQRIIALDVNHISCYSLTINPHTAFYIKGVKQPEDDLLREYYDLVNAKLEKAGFVHYEISNWCKPGYMSQHNLTYWRNEQYYGLGLGAAGYLDNQRYKNTLSLDKYNKGLYISEKENISKKDDILYSIMLNLRTIEGLDLNKFKQEYDIDLLHIKRQEINELIDEKLLIHLNNKLIPTYEGMMLLDTIILKLDPNCLF